MKTIIYCRNFEKSQYLETFIENTLNDRIPLHLQEEVIGVQVWLKIENSFLQRGKDVFSCKIKVKTRNAGAIFSSEKAGDCYEAGKVAIEEVATILKKKHNEQNGKRRGRMNFFRRFAFASRSS